MRSLSRWQHLGCRTAPAGKTEQTYLLYPTQDYEEEKRRQLLGPTGYMAYDDRAFWESDGKVTMKLFYMHCRTLELTVFNSNSSRRRTGPIQGRAPTLGTTGAA